MTQVERELATTRKSRAHLEAALEDLKANRHKYHPRTYAMLEEPLVEEIELRQSEINNYLWSLDPQPSGIAVRDPEPDGPPADEVSEPIADSDSLPTEEEISKLPRWAEFAFVSRCIRRILPHFLKNAQKMQAAPELRPNMVWAMGAVERIASDPNNNIEERRRARNVADYAGRDEVDLQSTRLVYFTAFALGAIADGSTGKAFYYFKDVVQNSGIAIGKSVGRDLTLLLYLSSLYSWTDDTPVPPTVFGPLWPEGPPPGWPEEENPNREIALEIDLPDDATDADVKRYVELLVSKADDVYRAGGGNGLKISGLEITGETLAEKPTPTADQPGECEFVGGGAT